MDTLTSYCEPFSAGSDALQTEKSQEEHKDQTNTSTADSGDNSTIIDLKKQAVPLVEVPVSAGIDKAYPDLNSCFCPPYFPPEDFFNPLNIQLDPIIEGQCQPKQGLNQKDTMPAGAIPLMPYDNTPHDITQMFPSEPQYSYPSENPVYKDETYECPNCGYKFSTGFPNNTYMRHNRQLTSKEHFFDSASNTNDTLSPTPTAPITRNRDQIARSIRGDITRNFNNSTQNNSQLYTIQRGLLCACRECCAVLLCEGRSPYCSKQCQVREQNIRQNRVRQRENMTQRKQALLKELAAHANELSDRDDVALFVRRWKARYDFVY